MWLPAVIFFFPLQTKGSTIVLFVMVLTFSLKTEAKQPDLSCPPTGTPPRVMRFGSGSITVSVDIFTASQSDFEFPGMIQRLTLFLLMERKCLQISKFKLFILLRRSKVGLILSNFNSLLHKLSFLFIVGHGLRAKWLPLKSEIGTSESTIITSLFSISYQASCTVLQLLDQSRKGKKKFLIQDVKNI